MPNLFLIANNHKVDKRIFKYLRKIDAKVIEFNYCVLLKYIQPDIVFVRGTRKKDLYHGMSLAKKRHRKSELFKKNPKIIFIDNYKTFKIYLAKKPNNYHFTRFKRYVKRYPGKYPSSGYVGIHYVMKHFRGYKVYLVGYTFHAPTHNTKFERGSTLRMIRNKKNREIRGIINSLGDVKKFFPHLFNRGLKKRRRNKK